MTDLERRRRVEDLCDAALNRDPHERTAFVAAACGGDEVLQQEVEALLAHARTAEGFLAAPIGAVAAQVLGGEHGASLVGRQVGAYQIVSHLGTGGMGEVYRARDTKLGRDVAIKVVPPAFTSDPERRARFEREARMLASLNHPHIGAIYGLEDGDGVRALVLEIVEGETLADKLAKLSTPSVVSASSGTPSGLPITEALNIAHQIAEALEAAHEKGIIHRDLKPANIKITPDGVVKVLDFGLAKAAAGDTFSPDLTQSPTVTVGGTREGIILGTASYMGPEQARGQPVDHRADIWAFGCVLYEMLTGRAAFPGDTVSDTIAAILERDPEWNALPANTPTTIRRLLRRCLAKDRKRRLADVADARLEIEDAGSEPVAPAPASQRANPLRRSHERLAWVAAAILLISTLVLATVVYLGPQEDIRVQKFSIALPEKMTVDGLGVFVPSPDRHYLAFGGTSEGKRMLWVRNVDSGSARPLAGTDGAVQPFWSPDSRSVGFFAQGKLKRVPISGGAALTLCDIPGGGLGGTWNRSGVILFVPDQLQTVYRVSESGGMPSAVTRLDRGRAEVAHNFPRFLPDDRHFIYSATGADGQDSWIKIGALDSSDTQPLVKVDSNAAYVSTATGNYLLFAREGTLYAQPFDVRKLAIAGEPLPVSEELVLQQPAMGSSTSRAAFSVSGGILVYRPGTGTSERQLVWVDRTGKPIEEVGALGEYDHVELSPDGKRVAVDRVNAQSRRAYIWLLDFSTGTPSRFTFDPSRFGAPRWSPDGTRLLFSREGVTGGHEHPGLYQKPSSGAGIEERLYESIDDAGTFASDWAPDGRFVVFRKLPPGTPGSLWILPLSGDRQPKPVPQTDARGANGRFSPDGRWLAYQSEQSGRFEVWVQPFPATGAKWQISRDGGARPRWRRDSKELFYVGPSGTLMAVAVLAGQTFQPSDPAPLFQTRFSPVNIRAYPYDVSPDGQRFLLITPREELGASPFTVVLNWDAGLKK